MGIPVSAEQTAEGWVLKTVDEYKDVIAGPFQTYKLTEQNAKDLDLDIIPAIAARAKNGCTAAELPIGHMFHAGEYWYRMIKPGKLCAVEAVGRKEIVKIPGDTPVIEISVLSLK